MSENDLSFQLYGKTEDSETLSDGRMRVLKGLLDFNDKKTSLVLNHIWVFMRDRKDRVLGGLLGYTLGDWLHIEILWVEESLRNKGNGTKLLKMA
jgi:hypothetical protein